MPFLIFPLIFGALGFFATVSVTKVREQTLPIMVEGAEHAPALMERVNGTETFEYVAVDNATTALREEEIFLYVAFPPGFEEELNASLNATLNLTVFYNSAVSRSDYALEIFTTAVANYSRQIVYDRIERVDLAPSALNPIGYAPEDKATKQQKSGAFLGQLVPYLIVIYLFAGAMSVGLDTITGEKERNTLSTLLVNRIKRESIVMGKILAVMLVAFISAGCTFAGIAASLAGAISFLGPAAGTAALGFASLNATVGLALLVILIPLSALIVSIIVLVGTYAKSIKEGSSLITPIYIIVIVIGVASMSIDFQLSLGYYAAPFIGALFSLKNAFLGKLTALQLLVSTITTLILTAILIYFCVRMFKNEKVIFRV